MLIISRTPVRISFFGGGTDYPSFFQKFGGAVLGTTINQFVHISLKTLQHAFFDHNLRIAYSKIEHVRSIDHIQHPSIRESLKYKGIEGNLDIHVFSDLPARTGLGSSSAFTVGFLNALSALQGKIVSKQKLAEEACHVEQNLIQENVGSQDCFHASFGGWNLIEFYSQSVRVKPVVLVSEKKQALLESLLVFYTGITRTASDIVKEQIEKTKERKNDAFLFRMKEMVYEAEEIISKEPADSMIVSLGRLMCESWNLKKQLSTKVATPEINAAYEKALATGAFGGKLCGAGGGGFIAFLVPRERRSSVREAMYPLQEVPLRFEDEGSRIIYMKDG